MSSQESGSFHTYNLDTETARVPLTWNDGSETATPDWIKLNWNGTGLYRVLYRNPHILDKFLASTRQPDANQKLSKMDVGNLVFDTLASAKLGLVSYRSEVPGASEFAKLVKSYQKFFKDVLQDCAASKTFTKILSKNFTKILTRSLQDYQTQKSRVEIKFGLKS